MSAVEIEKSGEGKFAGEKNTDITITVEKAAGEKCERCWSYSEDVSDNEKICNRCRKILSN